MRTLIVIPTYNEAENIENLTKKILSFLPQTDILIIDDNSPDGTGTLTQKLAKSNKQIILIQREGKLGLGSAYIRGFTFALENGYDFIFEMDADFSHNPKHLPEFLKYASTHNVILGSRYTPGGKINSWGLSRKLLSKMANLYARLILGLPYHDLTGGFKCFSRSVLEKINLGSIISEGYVFQIETTYRAHQLGFAIKEIPIVFEERRKGKSKISRRICLEAIWKVPFLRFSRVF